MNKRIAKKHLKVVSAIIIAPFVVKIGFNDRSKQVIDFGEWMKNQPKGIYDEFIPPTIINKEPTTNN